VTRAVACIIELYEKWYTFADFSPKLSFIVQYIIIIAGIGGAVGAQRLVLRVMSLKGRVRARARTRGRNPFVIL
jgi:hypothetical protein